MRRLFLLVLFALALPATADIFAPSPSALAVAQAIAKLEGEVRQLNTRVNLVQSSDVERAKNTLAGDVREHVNAVENNKPTRKVIGVLNGRTLYAEGDDYHVQ